mgnify:CR=1 FL=1
MVTLAGFGVTGAVLWASLTDSLETTTLAWVTLVATQLYVIGDHLDGLHAVASGATSALGEFLDHWSDFLSGGILGLAAVTLMGPELDPWIRHGVLWLYAQAFVVTYVERSERSILYFAPVGSLEGIVILSVWLLAWLFPAGEAFMSGPSLLGGLPGYWTLLAIAAVCFGGTVIVLLRRIGRVPPYYLAFVVTSASIVAAAALRPDLLPPPLGWGVLMLHGADFLARVMQPQLFETGRRLWPDLFAPAALLGVVAWGTPSGGAAVAMWVTSGWALLSTARTTGTVLHAFAEQWAWVNPDPPE